MTRTRFVKNAVRFVPLAALACLLMVAATAAAWGPQRDVDWAGDPDPNPFYEARDNKGGSGGPQNAWSYYDGLSGYTCPNGANQDAGYPNVLGDPALSGFAFSFYGEPIAALRLGSNGALSFTAGANGQIGNTDNGMPTTSVDTIFAGYWDDLDPSGSQVCFTVDGSGSSEVFVARYKGVPHFSGTETVSMLMLLFEEGQVLEAHYNDAQDDGFSNTQGISCDASWCSTMNPERRGIEYNQDSTSRTDEAIQYRPLTTFPVGTNDAYTLDFSAAQTLTVPATCGGGTSGVLCNDRKVGHVALSAVKLTDPALGSLSFNSDGSFTFDPPAADPCNESNGSAAYTFTYRADDAWPQDAAAPFQDRATVSITVTNCNEAPTAADDSYSLDEDSTLTINTVCTDARYKGVLCNDSDDDKIEDLTVTLVAGPTKAGSFVLNSDGSFAYTPQPDVVGSDSFTYEVSDGQKTDEATVAITIDALNDPPTWNAGSDVTIDEDNVTATDADGVVPVRISGWATALSQNGGADEAGQDLSIVIDAMSASSDPAFGGAPLFAVEPVFEIMDGVVDIVFTPTTHVHGTAQLTVRAVDDGPQPNSTGSVSFTITVHPSNDAPVFTPGTDFLGFVEGVTSSETAGWATGIGPGGGADEASQSLFFTLTPEQPGVFQSPPLLPASGADQGRLSFTAYAEACTDWGTVVGDVVEVVLEDNGGIGNNGRDRSEVHELRIGIACVNDAPSFTKGANEDVTESNVDGGTTHTRTGWATAVTPGGQGFEDDQALTFDVLQTSGDATVFAVPPAITYDADAETAALSYTLAKDRCSEAPTTFEVRLRDDGPGSSDPAPDGETHVNETGVETFSIQVACVNDPPRFDPQNPVQVTEDGGPYSGIWAEDLAPGSEDEGSQSVSFSALPSSPLFLVQPAVTDDGTLSFTVAEDQCGVYEEEITATDDGPSGGGHVNARTETLRIEIACVNDAPVATLQVPSLTFDEDVGTVDVATSAWVTAHVGAVPEEPVQQIIAFDVDHDAPEGFFVTEPAMAPGGRAGFTAAPDACGPVTLTIRAVDDGGEPGTDTSAPVDLPLLITCINDAPIVVAATAIAVDEDVGPATLDLLLAPTRPGPDAAGVNEDQEQTFTEDLDATNLGMFTQSPVLQDDGTVTFTTLPDACGVSQLTYTATDDGVSTTGGDDTTVVVVPLTIHCVNDAPSADVIDVDLLEDQGGSVGTTIVGFVSNTSPGGGADEASQGFSYTISFSNSVITAEPPVVDENGDLWVRLTPDACGNSLGSVDMVDDGDQERNGINTTSIPFVIRVACVNDPPTFVPGPHIERYLGGSLASETISLWATDLHPGAFNEVDQSTSFTWSTPDAAVLDVLEIDADGTLTFTPAGVGTTEVEVCIRDDGGSMPEKAIQGLCHGLQFTFLDRNDPPTFTPGPDVTVSEDSGAFSMPWATAASPGPEGEEWQDVAFLVYVDDPSLFTSGGQPFVDSDGVLYFTPAPDASGSTVVLVAIFDNGGVAGGGSDTSGWVPVTITVSPGPDAPVAQDNGYDALEDNVLEVLPPGILANDSDLDGDTLTAHLVTTPQQGTLALEEDGSFRYTPRADYFGVDQFAYSAKDPSGLSATALVTIRIGNVNDGPRTVPDNYLIRPGSVHSVSWENGVLANDIDPDGDRLRAVLVAPPDGGELVLHENGAFRYTPGEARIIEDSFTYRVEDSNGAWGQPSLVRIRLAANEPPTAAFSGPERVAAGATAHFIDQSRDIDGWGYAPADGAPLNSTPFEAWSWDFGDGTTSTVQHPNHAWDTPGTYTVTLTVRDPEGATATATRTVTVVDGFLAQDGGTVTSLASIDAGPDRMVRVGQAVEMQGSVAKGNADRVLWIQESGPLVRMVDADKLLMRFQAPDNGEPTAQARFVLRVFDGVGWSQDNVTIDIWQRGVQPTVHAGADFPVPAGGMVVLEATSGGFPADWDVQYQWSQTRGPLVGITGFPSKAVSFRVPAAEPGTVLAFQVVASSGGLRSPADTIELLVEPRMPSGFDVVALGAGAYRLTAVEGFESYQWTFSDGATADGREVVHRFTTAGFHTVSLAAAGPQGEDVHEQQVLVPATGEVDPVMEFLREYGRTIAIAMAGILGVSLLLGGIFVRRR